MAMLTREQMLAKQPVKIEKATISTGDVFVRQMYGRDKDSFESSLGYWETKIDDKSGEQSEVYVRTMEHFRAKLAVHTVCDKDGNLLFKPEDAEALSENMLGSDLMVIATAAQRLNKISNAERKAIAKN